MIPVHHGNTVRLWDERTPIAHIVGQGQRLLWRRRSAPISVQDASNARRERADAGNLEGKVNKHTERRQQLRRANDGESLHIAARHVLAAGGSDFAIVDGRAVEITARVLEEDEAHRVIKNIAEANHDRATD